LNAEKKCYNSIIEQLKYLTQFIQAGEPPHT